MIHAKKFGLVGARLQKEKAFFTWLQDWRAVILSKYWKRESYMPAIAFLEDLKSAQKDLSEAKDIYEFE